MQDVGQHQLLMLLLMLQAEFDQREQRRIGLVLNLQPFDQRQQRRIDMRAKAPHLGGGWPRQQPALRPRMARAERLVIGIEEKAEAFVEDAIAAAMRSWASK